MTRHSSKALSKKPESGRTADVTGHGARDPQPISAATPAGQLKLRQRQLFDEFDLTRNQIYRNLAKIPGVRLIAGSLLKQAFLIADREAGSELKNSYFRKRNGGEAKLYTALRQHFPDPSPVLKIMDKVAEKGGSGGDSKTEKFMAVSSQQLMALCSDNKVLYDRLMHIRNALLESLTPLASHLAEKSILSLRDSARTLGVEKEDLTHEALCTASRAIYRYAPEREILFQTYIGNAMNGGFLDYFRAHGQLIKVGRDQGARGRKALSISQSYRAKHGREPTIKELSEIMETPEKQVKMALKHVRYTFVRSLDEPARNEKGEEKKYADSLAAEGLSPQEKATSQERHELLLRAIATELPEYIAENVKDYYGLEGRTEKTLEEIAVADGVTREAVRQRMLSAVKKIKAALPASWSHDGEMF